GVPGGEGCALQHMEGVSYRASGNHGAVQQRARGLEGKLISPDFAKGPIKMTIPSRRKIIRIQRSQPVARICDDMGRAEGIKGKHRDLAWTFDLSEPNMHDITVERSCRKAIAAKSEEEQSRILDLRHNPDWIAWTAEELEEWIIRRGGP